MCRDLLHIMLEEIKTELLEQQSVIDMTHIMHSENGKKVPIALLVLTFNIPTVPDHIYTGYQRLIVKPYVPNTQSCFKCQGYGHMSSTCTMYVENVA